MTKIILQSLMMHKKKYMLTVIQFVICFFALIFAVSMISDVLEYKSRVEELSDLDLVHIYSIDENINYDIESTKAILKSLDETFYELKSESFINKFGIFEKINIRKEQQTKSNEDLNVIMVSKELLEISKIRLSEGEMYSFFEYQTETTEIPILVSEVLKEQFKLNETYTYYILRDSVEERIEFTVKGYVESPEYFWRGNASDITSTLSSGDKFIICPQFKDFSILSYLNNILIKLNGQSENDVRLLAEYLESNAIISYEHNTLQGEINEYYTRQKEIIIPVAIFSIVILVLALLGCIGVILCNLISRKREFGVYYSIGLSQKRLMIILCGEIFCVFVLSFLIASIASIFLFNAKTLSVLIAFATMLVCVLLCELVPITKFSKLEIINLINENVRE